LLFLLATHGAAQRAITVQNLVPQTRDEWISASVPFAEGAVPSIPELHVEGCATVWQPFGARWPDGSVRQALCFFRRELGPMSELRLPLISGAGPELGETTFGLGEHRIVFVVTQGETVTRHELEPFGLVEKNAARQVVLLRSRLGDTGLVGELVIELYADQPHAYCGLSVFFSDPTTEAFECRIDELAIETDRVALFCRHADALGVTTELTETGSRVTLLRDAVLGDGQGIRRGGALVPRDPGTDAAQSTCGAAAICKPLAATEWADSGAFGAFGYVPELPPWLVHGRVRTAFAERHARFVAASRTLPPDPFQVGKHQCAKAPGQTGDQADFGVVQLEPVARTAIPSFLYEVELSVLQEGCRPVHFFETDATPVTADRHPDWVVWAGRTHWDHHSSPDRLGKPKQEPRFETHGWQGKKRSHWSSNYQCAYYLLTGCPLARLDLENEVRLYLAGQTVDPNKVTSGIGQARSLGRALHAATWLYLCTGHEPLLQRMIDRVHDVAIPSWFGRDRDEDQLRPFGINGPDGRVFGGKHPFWPAWMDTLAVIGPAAVYEVTGDDRSKEFADALALNTLRHAWRETDHGVRIVYALRWADDGRLPTGEELWDPDFTHTSGSIATWGVPSLAWAARAAAERDLGELAERADRLLGKLRSARRPPADGWFDRFGEWDAIR
ncbi:MAG: hypothetical protein KDB80_18130, partial [Planctomycetes bacterium]|nr:hypothetical protein [Planctomycetota bacterium]